MSADTTTLGTGLDQLVTLVGQVDDASAGAPTPCRDWTVDDLVDHVVEGTRNFARGVRGEDVDWSAATPHVEGDRAAAMRAAADDLLAAWAAADESSEGPPPQWQCSELAVHTWDLATALGRPTADLDPTVAEQGLAFMSQGLTDDNRGEAFGPEQPAPDDADAYERVAAFAGRPVGR